MDLNSISEKFFDEYSDFLLDNNLELAKKVWNKNKDLV